MHVGDHKFGADVKIEQHIADVVQVPKRFISTDLQMVLRERYEQSHGIYNHAGANDHLALVRHHWSEDAIGASRLRERLEAFKDNRVYQVFGLSFKEFLEQPPYVCDLQLEILKNSPPEHNKELEDLLTEMGKNKGKN